MIKLKTKEIDYFDFTAKDKRDIVIFKKHVIYKKVYEFKNRINIYKLYYSNKEVKNLILICLRDDVLK